MNDVVYTKEAKVFQFPSGFWGVARRILTPRGCEWDLHTISHRTKEDAEAEIKKQKWRDVTCTNVLTVVPDP